MKSIPTKSIRFNETNWRDRREQATPILSKILDDLRNKATWKQQQIFLSRCRDRGFAPKGLRVLIPKKIMTKDLESKLKRKCEIELIQKTIKLLHAKQQKADERIATLKLSLKDKFNMSRNWIENTMQWLTKKAEKKGDEKKNVLKRKFQQLNEEKMKFDKELNDSWRSNELRIQISTRKWYIITAVNSLQRNK